MNSIYDIDLSPKKGKTYWKSCHREWREEFIYFLMVDRFHDSAKRQPLSFSERHTGFGDSNQLRASCGGTIGFALSIFCVLLIVYVPVFNLYFHTSSLLLVDWLFPLAAGMLCLVIYEYRKKRINRQVNNEALALRAN